MKETKNENDERLSRLIFEMWRFIIRWCLKFRNNSVKSYELCCSYYYNAPGLSWDAMIEMTKIELELITDPDMFIFLQKLQETEFLIFPIDIAKPIIYI